MRRLVLGLLIGLWASAALAQTCPTRQPGDNTNACASTAFVQNAVGGGTVTLTNTHIFVGNASNVATDVALSGDGTMANTGAITVTKTSGVAFGPFATGTDAANLTGTLAAGRMPALTGDVTSSAGSVATTLASVISAGGPTGSATVAPIITFDAKGRLTAVSSATVTPAESSVTFTDITTNNVSTTKHGYTPKLPNDATKYLDGTGAYSTPSSAGSAPVLLATLTASNSASLADTTSLTATYPRYEIVFTSIVPATDNVSCRLRVNVSGVQTTGYNTVYQKSDGSTQLTAAPTTYITCGEGVNGTASKGGVSGSYYLYNPSQSVSPKAWVGTLNVTSTGGSANQNQYISSGAYQTGVAAVTGLQVDMSSGNITSGTVKIYGLP